MISELSVFYLELEHRRTAAVAMLVVYCIWYAKANNFKRRKKSYLTRQLGAISFVVRLAPDTTWESVGRKSYYYILETVDTDPLLIPWGRGSLKGWLTSPSSPYSFTDIHTVFVLKSQISSWIRWRLAGPKPLLHIIRSCSSHLILVQARWLSNENFTSLILRSPTEPAPSLVNLSNSPSGRICNDFFFFFWLGEYENATKRNESYLCLRFQFPFKSEPQTQIAAQTQVT